MSSSTDFDVTLPDVSPMLMYAPKRDSDTPATGWKLSYDGSPDSSYDTTHVNQNEGRGNSSHWSSMDGAQVSLDFYGTGVTIFGSAKAGAYITTIDSTDTTGAPQDTKLFVTESLTLGKHRMSLKLNGGGGLNLTSVVVKGAVGAPVIPKNEDAVTPAGLASDFFKTSGAPWTTQHSDGKYARIDTNAVGGIASFTVSNASAVVVYGTSNYDHQTYSVNVNPPVGASTEERTFNATSRWFSYNNIIFFETGMNPNTTYNVQFKNLVVNNYLDIHSAQILEPADGSSSPSSVPVSPKGGLSKGAITGIAVGAAIVGILAIILVLLWKKKQRAVKAHAQQIDAEVKTTPFGLDQSAYMVPSFATQSPSSTYTSTPAPYHPNSGQTLSYNPSPGPQNSRQYLTEYGSTPYQTRSANNSGSGFTGIGMIPPSKWSQNNPGVLNPHDLLQPRTSAGNLGSSSGGSDVAEASSSSSGPLRQVKVENPATSPAERPPPRQEVDAGPAVLPAEEPEPETLPPGYNPQWSGAS